MAKEKTLVTEVTALVTKGKALVIKRKAFFRNGPPIIDRQRALVIERKDLGDQRIVLGDKGDLKIWAKPNSSPQGIKLRARKFYYIYIL